MKLMLVCGPWSSGTTAVSGMLDALGLDGCGPFFRTNDERTRNSFESLAFREVVDAAASDVTMSLLRKPEEIVQSLTEFRQRMQARRTEQGADPEQPIFLKYPLSGLMIPHICRVFQTRLIYVLRPVRDVEQTRLRRNWPENFGAKGAQALYSRMFQVLVDAPFPTLILRYPELVKSPMVYARQLAAYAELKGVDPARLQAAADFVRQG